MKMAAAMADRRDRNWLYLAVLARSLATGMIGVLLGVHLATLELSAPAIGAVIAQRTADGADTSELLRHGD